MPAHYGPGKGKPKPIGGRKPLAGKPTKGDKKGSKKPGVMGSKKPGVMPLPPLRPSKRGR